jgi:hypothetical protein
MNDAEWQTCTEPEAMLRFLENKVSNRKLRLFAVACCRRVWPLLIDDRSRQAVEVAEQFAEGLAGRGARVAVRTAALAAVQTSWQDCPANDAIAFPQWQLGASGRATAASAAQWVAARKAYDAARTCAAKARYARAAVAVATEGTAKGETSTLWTRIEQEEKTRQVTMLRDLFGNPFRRVVAEPAWLSWRGGELQRLVREIEAKQAFDQLPKLIELLREAGCGEKDLVEHCGREGQHVRGCWMIDLLLGKE